MTVDVSIIVPTRDPDARVLERLETTLASARRSKLPFELLVVHSVPTRSGEALLRRFDGDASVKRVEARRPGAAHAKNIGLEVARGRCVLFHDDDVWVDEDWVANLSAPLLRG